MDQLSWLLNGIQIGMNKFSWMDKLGHWIYRTEIALEGGGEDDNFGIRKALIGRIYTSFYVVPNRTIAYEAP